MAIAELSENGRISVQIDWVEKDRIKLVPGSRWDPQSKMWHVPLSWASCKVLRGVFGPRLTLGDRLNAWAWNERQTRVEPATQLRQVIDYEHGDTRLMGHQRGDVAWWYYAKQGLLGNEPGCGKTASAVIGTRTFEVASQDAFPALVVCPNSMKLTWAAEWAMWDPCYDPLTDSVHFIIIAGGKPDKTKAFKRAHDLIAKGEKVVVIVNWESTWRHSRVAPYGSIRLTAKDKELKELNEFAFRTVIVDEAHRMKDAHSKQTRATWSLQHGPEVKYRLAMTGTPVANHTGDLWALMHGLAPHEFPTKTAYIDRYCLQSYNAFGALEILGVRPDTADEFYSIFDPRFRRMTKDVVLAWLPKKVRPLYHCDMSPKQRKAYKDIDEQMVTRLDDGSVIMTTNNLARNTRLLQFSSAYATVDEAGDVHLSEPSPKLDTMMEILEDREGQQIVIAAESRQLIELAAKRLDKAGISYGMIVGGMTQEQREQQKLSFQAGQLRCMLMTLKAGGTGITLTAAGTIVFLQRSWSLIDNLQGEDRVHRIGSEVHDKIEVIDMITAGTVEELLIPRMKAKLGRLQEITRDKELLIAQGRVAEAQALEAEAQVILATPLWARDGDLTALITSTEEEVA